MESEREKLLCYSMTFEIKYLRIHIISIHMIFYQIRFINECARKIKAKFPKSHIFTDQEFLSFKVSELFVRFRRTYVLN